MLFRSAVVWLFSFAILLANPAKGMSQAYTYGPKLLGGPSHTPSLLPATESSLHSLRSQADADALQPPQPSNLLAIYAISETANHYAIHNALDCLCRGMPLGQAPPSIC